MLRLRKVTRLWWQSGFQISWSTSAASLHERRDDLGAVVALLPADEVVHAALGERLGGELADVVLPAHRALPSRGPSSCTPAHELGDHLLPALALGGRDPGPLEALLGDAQVVDHPLEQLELAPGVVVAFGVVAVAGVAAADEHAVGALLERLEGEQRVDAARAGHADAAAGWPAA